MSKIVEFKYILKCGGPPYRETYNYDDWIEDNDLEDASETEILDFIRKSALSYSDDGMICKGSVVSR